MTLGKGLESLIPKKNNNISLSQTSPVAPVSAQPTPASNASRSDAGWPVSEPPAVQFQEEQEYFDDSAAKPARNASHSDAGGRHHYAKRPMVNQAVFLIEVDKISPNPFQPRKNFDQASLKDLADSITEHGILQPLIVSKIENETETGTSVSYQLIAGERRLMAAKIAGLDRVPAIVRQINGRAEHLEVAIIENLQRENLDHIETARAYARLSDEFGLTQREIATRLGKSREVVANSLRLLSLPSEFQAALSKNIINESQARLLLSIESPAAQKILFDEIISKNLSVREIRGMVKKIRNSGEAEPVEKSPFIDAEMRTLEEKLKSALGAEVKIENKGETGKIVINFYSPEEIYGIIHKINPHTNDDY